MNALDGILDALSKLVKRVERLETMHQVRWVYLTTPLTSTSWDGDAYSTTAKTLIDLSAVFGVPAGVKAVLCEISIRDIDSTGPDDNFLILSPNDTAGSGCIIRSKGRYDNDWESQELTVPCNTDGDIYYQIAASGAGSLTAYVLIWGYEI